MAHVRDAGLRVDTPNKWDAPLVLSGGAPGAAGLVARRSLSGAGEAVSCRYGSFCYLLCFRLDAMSAWFLCCVAPSLAPVIIM